MKILESDNNIVAIIKDVGEDSEHDIPALLRNEFNKEIDDNFQKTRDMEAPNEYDEKEVIPKIKTLPKSAIPKNNSIPIVPAVTNEFIASRIVKELLVMFNSPKSKFSNSSNLLTSLTNIRYEYELSGSLDEAFFTFSLYEISRPNFEDKLFNKYDSINLSIAKNE